jgi:hypothetical protein
MYTNGKMANYPGQYVNPVDFYNYLDYLNFGGLVKAYTGTESDDTLGVSSQRFHSDLYDENTEAFDFNPYNTEYKGYDLRTKDGDLYNQYEEGEFTTSKIEKDRRKSDKLFEDQEDYLYDESLGTKANWMDQDIKEGDNPLANKKWSLHNTTGDTMYYDKYNPTKLYSEEDWTKKGDEDLVNRSIDMLNQRHKKNPELFQEVTGYDPKTKEITYAGEKLKGDLAAENVTGTGYLAFGKKEGEDDFNFMGSLLEDDKGSIEGKQTAFNPVTDTEGNIKDIKAEDQKYSFNPARIGFEIDKPMPTPASQMDVLKPLNTITRAPEGKEVDWQSIYEKRGDMYKDMNLEDYITEAKRQQGLHDQYGQWDYRSADEYGKHKQLQDLLGVSSQEVWDERYKPEGERMYDSLSGFEKKYVRNNLGVTEDELLSYYTHPDLSQRPAPSSDVNKIADAKSKIAERERELGIKPGDPGSAGYVSPAPANDEEMSDEQLEEWWGGLSFDEQQDIINPGQSKFGQRYAFGEGPNSWGWLGDALWSVTGAPLSHALDTLSIPVNFLAEGIEGIAGTGDGEFNWSGIALAYRGDFSFDTMDGESKRISNLIGMEDSHWLPKLGVDILTDPITYATFGLAGGAKGLAGSGAKALSKEGMKNIAKNMARQYGPTAGKIAAGSGAAGLATPYIFGSDPSKVDEFYGDEMNAEDAGMYNWNSPGEAEDAAVFNWNPYPYSDENINQMQQPVMLASYGGGLPSYREAGEYSYRLDEDGNYQPQSQMMEDISESSELCSCDANIPASDTVKCQEACAKKEEEVTEVDEVEEKKERDPNNRNFEKGYEAVMQGLGTFNKIMEGRPEDFSNNQLAMNQFQTDSRDNRGMTDVNTGMQFQDKRIISRQGRYGSELSRFLDGGDRTTQLRNRQYDDGDQRLNDIELDEDTIKELIAMGAEIDYI